MSDKSDTRRRRLMVEFELPDWYVDDLPEIIAEHGFGDDESEDILNCVGQWSFGALTVQVIGEKDGEVVTVPVIAHKARIEDIEPNKHDHSEHLKSLMYEATEGEIEKAYDEGYEQGMKDGPLPSTAASTGQERPS